MSKPIIEVQNLTKSYGTFQAVKDISFTVAQGSLFAFLGTNGAENLQQFQCFVR